MWRFNEPKIEAITTQILNYPLVLEYGDDSGNSGNYVFRSNYHLVWIRQSLSIDEANKTLLHEIAHAYQAERSGNPHLFYDYMYVRSGNYYEQNKFEVQAEQFANDNQNIMLLIGD